MSDKIAFPLIAIPFVLFLSFLAWTNGGWLFALEIFLAGGVSMTFLYFSPLDSEKEKEDDENGTSSG